ncbi:MAG: metal-sensitive transcriptional regulator [Leptospiraceae bacterium]|nr:metal-sensitive transcriptional regulator [Leptospiraceae bacterium]MCP5499941.1 metal-sensitive transcriptional regulator [Leptospiraceae bacterium]
MENLPLIHRLNRIQGQIEAIKKTLQNEEERDCIKIMRLVKAANNALKKFSEVYVTEHMEECMRNGSSSGKIEQEMKEVISSVFNL